MKTYYMKIRDKYIDAVRQGIKKHEYRLASPERTQIRIGDNIILISDGGSWRKSLPMSVQR